MDERMNGGKLVLVLVLIAATVGGIWYFWPMATNAGAAIDLTLPPEESSNGLVFGIAETGGAFAITVKNDAGGTVVTVALSTTVLVGCDGAAWAVVG